VLDGRPNCGPLGVWLWVLDWWMWEVEHVANTHKYLFSFPMSSWGNDSGIKLCLWWIRHDHRNSRWVKTITTSTCSTYIPGEKVNEDVRMPSMRKFAHKLKTGKTQICLHSHLYSKRTFHSAIKTITKSASSHHLSSFSLQTQAVKPVPTNQNCLSFLFLNCWFRS
jgi:hypothetical protein